MRFVTVTLAAALAAAPAFAQDADPRKQEAAAIVQAFFGELKGELEAGMAQGGPVNAIAVCNEKAPGIAAAHAARTGWTVGRTSLKLRNAKNAPDAWERKVLEEFEARKAAGEKPDTLVKAEVVDGRYRFMKAIPTGNVCLNCHGGEIKPEVEAKLKALYPQDAATGFRVNDLRGAFTLSRKS